MTLQERLRLFLDYKSQTPKEFEQIAGLGNATAARISEVSRNSTFDRIATAFPELNIDWLKSGDGEMLKPSGVTQVSHGDNSPNLNGRAVRVMNGDTAATKALAEALAKAQEQTAKSQEQIDRLLTIIERMQTGNR